MIDIHLTVDNIWFSVISEGRKIDIMITISIQIDIIFAMPLGSSFQPNDLIIGLFQIFIQLS